MVEEGGWTEVGAYLRDGWVLRGVGSWMGVERGVGG